MSRNYILRLPPKVEIVCERCGRKFQVSRLSVRKRSVCSLECKKPVLERLSAKSIVSENNCWLWKGCTQDNHGKIGFNGRSDYVHRVSWILFNGPIPKHLHVLHNCVGAGTCWNPHHLRLGTQADNNADRVKQGRNGNHKGMANGRALVTEQEVKWMRANYCRYGHNGKLSSMDLARKFNLPQPTIWQIVNGKSWKHLDR